MTERKPPGISFESWVDKQVRQAQERGDFDDLPGSGKPLPSHPDDEMWWIREYVVREGLSADALLPTPLQLRKEIERLPATVAELHTEQAVRDTVADLNARILHWLRAPSGPQVPIRKVDADEIVAEWRANRQQRAEPPPIHPEPAQRRRTSWWRGLTGR